MKSMSIWKGSLSFGLVNINIELYTAIRAHSFGFKLLHAKCKMPIQYKRWCEHCSQEVEWDDIVKGYKLEDGSYFILTKENLEKLKPEKTEEITIVEFIDARSLETIYFDEHYYIAPTKVTDKAFFLFARILEKLDKFAIGRFVMRDREYVCAIQAFRNTLLLSTLNYEYEIRQVAKIDELQVFKTLPEELKLAGQLVQKLSVKKFDMSRFKDSFEQKLLQKVKQYVKGGVHAVEHKKQKAKTSEGSLIKDLQASLKNKKTAIAGTSKASNKVVKRKSKAK